MFDPDLIQILVFLERVLLLSILILREPNLLDFYILSLLCS